MAVNRPIIIKRGWPGEIEANQIHGYVGEWVVFKLEMNDGTPAEFRVPIEKALEEGLVVAADSLVFSPEDFEEDERGHYD